MRNEYWGAEARGVSLTDLPAFYSEWIGYGLNEIGGLSGLMTSAVETKRRSVSDEDSKPSTLFERSGNLHMLLLVQKATPTIVPFFYGETYAPIPRLLIPRFLDEAKGISHAGNIMMTVAYGLQTREQTASTSIGWGLVPEAYANFGFLGVGMLAVALGLFYSVVTRLGVGVPMTSLRFVAGLLVMSAATSADTMGIFVTSQFQGIVGLSLASLLLMRSQRNPFADGEFGTWDVTQRSAGSTHAVGQMTGASSPGEDGSPGLSPDIAPLLPMFQPAPAAPEDSVLRRRGVHSQAVKRLPRWAPRFQHAALRQRLAVEQQRSKDKTATSAPEEGQPERKRTRQLSVPFQGHYRRR